MVKPLLINGEPFTPTAEERRRHEEHLAARNAPVQPKPRVFDHLDTIPAAAPPVLWAAMDRHFSRAARRMRSSARWHSVPTYQQPAAVSGEFVERKARVMAAIDRLVEADPGALADAVEALGEKRREQLARMLRAKTNH